MVIIQQHRHQDLQTVDRKYVRNQEAILFIYVSPILSKYILVLAFFITEIESQTIIDKLITLS
jgi:hypothetical protein